MKQRTLLLACSVVAVCGTCAMGDVVEFDAAMSFAGSNLNGVVGTGISNANFVRSYDDDQAVEIGLKTIERFVGDLSNTGSDYFADAGESDPGLATWNYVLAADLGSRTIADFQINLLVDFDPGVGTTDFVDVDVTAAFVDAGFGFLSRFGDSQNLGFSFWSLLGAPGFDPFAAGEYDLVFSVRDLTGSLIAESSNTVHVVPLPPAALAGFAMLAGVAGYRRLR